MAIFMIFSEFLELSIAAGSVSYTDWSRHVWITEILNAILLFVHTRYLYGQCFKLKKYYST